MKRTEIIHRDGKDVDASNALAVACGAALVGLILFPKAMLCLASLLAVGCFMGSDR